MKRGRISFFYLLFGLLSVFIIGVMLYFSLSTVMINDAITTTEMSVNQSGRYLEVYIERLKSLSHIIAKNGDVVEYFSGDGNASNIYQQRINGLIDQVLVSDDTLKSIVIISKDGKVFSNEEDLNMQMSADMMKEEWYVSAIHSEMPILTSARMQKFSMDKELWVISLSQEIVNDLGENIGVVVLDIPYTVFESFLMELDLGETGFAFILNDNNEVVFHMDTSYYIEETKQQNLLELKNSSLGYQPRAKRLINQYKLENTDWTLVGVCSVDSLTVIKRQLLETLFLGSLAIFIGVLVTGVILKRLTTEIQEKEMNIYRYKMNALYGQINPHFLYNTLDTIVWMAEFNQSEDVIKTTKSLAQFFRLSLNQGKEFTSIKDEIDHVKEYLYIQKQRYQEKLNYSIDVDEETLEVLVPKIVLQPIVENSIYHGIKDLDVEGHIDIQVRKVDKEIHIMVKDNGLGFDESTLKEGLPVSNKIKLGGVGLDNVNRRIKLYFGDAYGVFVQSKLGEGTIVTIKLFAKGESTWKSR